MRRRFCGGTSHISDMLENGIWVITLYEGIIKGDRYDNRFITPGMICVIEDNIRFCYREFNVQDYTPIKWIEGVSRIPDILSYLHVNMFSQKCPACKDKTPRLLP